MEGGGGGGGECLVEVGIFSVTYGNMNSTIYSIYSVLLDNDSMSCRYCILHPIIISNKMYGNCPKYLYQQEVYFPKNRELQLVTAVVGFMVAS